MALLTPAMAALEQEALRVMLLDTRNGVMGVRSIYKGSLNTSVVRIGEIFHPAIEDTCDKFMSTDTTKVYLLYYKAATSIVISRGGA